MKPIRIVIIGAGGYGAGYVRELLDHPDRTDVCVVGIVEPYPDSCPYLAEIKARGIPVYAAPEQFYQEHAADLAVISSPIQFHAEQSVYAMEHGSHVLMEKPVAADMDCVRRIEEAMERTGKICSIGFQWCFNEAMLSLKEDILSGALGRPLSLKAIALWPRSQAYYRRGIGWAGKRYDAQGRAVKDTVVSNATAHYLMNMLWLLGDSIDTAAELENIRAVTSRVNAIEMFDTVFLRGEAAGAKVLYIASHAVEDAAAAGPLMEYAFERGTLTYEPTDGIFPLIVRMNDGSERRYEGMNADAVTGRKLWNIVDLIETGEGIIPCGVQTAKAHTKVMDHINDLPVHDFAKDSQYAYDAEKEIRYLPGLAEKLMAGYTAFSEPSAEIFT